MNDPVRIRPLLPGDRPRYLEFLGALHPEDLYLRTMGGRAPPGPDRVTELLAADGRSAVALAAVDGSDAILGVARAAIDADRGTAEFALIVRSDRKRRGLGLRLLRALLAELGARGIRRVVGQTFAHNAALLRLAQRTGFRIGPGDDATTREVTIALAPV